MDKISVVIPTYKSPDALDLCLKSCIEGAHNLNNIEILVGVDGTYDTVKDVLKTWDKYINILKLDENIGLPRITNLLVYNASYPNILIINDDNIAPLHYDKKLNELDTNNTVWAPNQIEPIPSMFKQFHIQNLGRDPKTFNLGHFWAYEEGYSHNIKTETGSTLPIFMKKIDYIRLGGWDENYEKGMVADWDFFLKCSLSGLKMMRTYNLHFYHFVSLSVNDNESQTTYHVTRREAEWRAHQYTQYKWGTNIKHNPETNLKYL